MRPAPALFTRRPPARRPPLGRSGDAALEPLAARARVPRHADEGRVHQRGDVRRRGAAEGRERSAGGLVPSLEKRDEPPVAAALGEPDELGRHPLEVAVEQRARLRRAGGGEGARRGAGGGLRGEGPGGGSAGASGREKRHWGASSGSCACASKPAEMMTRSGPKAASGVSSFSLMKRRHCADGVRSPTCRGWVRGLGVPGVAPHTRRRTDVVVRGVAVRGVVVRGVMVWDGAHRRVDDGRLSALVDGPARAGVELAAAAPLLAEAVDRAEEDVVAVLLRQPRLALDAAQPQRRAYSHPRLLSWARRRPGLETASRPRTRRPR